MKPQNDWRAPIDQADRDTIAVALDETLFVEAGAGTGKTSALVSRIVALIESGRCGIDNIAAITFTEAAASELRERVRSVLESRLVSPETTPEKRISCQRALAGMESASIQTLHSFAGTLLRQRPLEAGLPPGFDTWADLESGVHFEKHWQEWLDDALESSGLGPGFALGLTLGIRLDDLRNIAVIFHNNYDLLADPLSLEQMPARDTADEIIQTAAEIERLLPLSHLGTADVLSQHAVGVVALGRRLETLDPASDAALGILFRWGRLSQPRGRQSDWDTDPATDINGCTLLKSILKGLEDSRAAELEKCGRSVLISLVEGIRQFVRGYAEERKMKGTAGFHDLLVWARDLLKNSQEARVYFRNRFQYILVDEFQDTDPIQAEISCLLAGTDSPDSELDWTSVQLDPGRLFVVGDPKQSIYRFRRADIEALSAVQSIVAEKPVRLVQNFRSTAQIINWVNRLFEQWMEAETDGAHSLQAQYIPLSPSEPSAQAADRSVYRIGGAGKGKALQIRREEAYNLARLAKSIRDNEWVIREQVDGSARAARYQDICLLLPARTGLRILEQAFEREGVPFRVEGQSLVLATQDVRDLLMCLRSIDSPADQVALIAALRSSAFACSDVELFQFSDQGGVFNYLKDQQIPGPVSESMEVLRRFHLGREWWAIEELVERLIRERRMVETSFGRARPRERWRRLRFVVDQARVYSQIGGPSLRSFLDWMDRQADEHARIVEVPVPESDEDAVRIMTIHAAKGLEFPVVLLAGLGAGESRRTVPAIFDRSANSVEVGLGRRSDPIRFRTAGFDDAADREGLAKAAENVRLAYVAATRARDHLVLSLFHSDNNPSCPAAAIIDYMSEEEDLWSEISPDSIQGVAVVPGAPRPAMAAFGTASDRSHWVERREKVLSDASRPETLAATSLAAAGKEEADQGQTRYRRGRAGSNIGRAVHSVLQTVDIESGEGLTDICKAQAAAEGVGSRWEEVRTLAQTALDSEVVRQAVGSGRYFRELFVSYPISGILLEGFVDLLYESPEGLIIVDYKTDNVDTDEEIDRAHERYGLQMGAYAAALQRSTGKTVVNAVLLFLRPKRTVMIDDIQNLISLVDDRASELVNTV